MRDRHLATADAQVLIESNSRLLRRHGFLPNGTILQRLSSLLAEVGSLIFQPTESLANSSLCPPRSFDGGIGQSLHPLADLLRGTGHALSSLPQSV